MSTESWRVILYTDRTGALTVTREIAEAPPKDGARILRFLRLLEASGLLLRGQYVRHIRGKLFELRPEPWRVLYFAADGQTFVALHCFRKKTQRTPLSEIALAEARMIEYLERTNQ